MKSMKNINNNRLVNNTIESNKINPKTLRVVMYILIAATSLYCLNSISIVTRDGKSPVLALSGYFIATLMYTKRYADSELKTAKIILCIASIATGIAVIVVSVIMKYTTIFFGPILNCAVGTILLTEIIFSTPANICTKKCNETLFWIIFAFALAILPSIMLTLSEKVTFIAQVVCVIILSVYLMCNKFIKRNT